PPLRRYGDQLGQIPDAVVLDVLPCRLPVDFHGAGGGTEITQHHGDQRGLAGSIGTGDAKYLTAVHHQRKLLDRFYRVAEEWVVSLPDAFELDHNGGGGPVVSG